MNNINIIEFLFINNLINNLSFTDNDNNTILHHVIANNDIKTLNIILSYIKKT